MEQINIDYWRPGNVDLINFLKLLIHINSVLI